MLPPATGVISLRISVLLLSLIIVFLSACDSKTTSSKPNPTSASTTQPSMTITNPSKIKVSDAVGYSLKPKGLKSSSVIRLDRWIKDGTYRIIKVISFINELDSSDLYISSNEFEVQ